MIDLAYVPQKRSFLHFKVLRKVVRSKSSGVILYQAQDGIKGRLFFKQGKIYNDYKNDDNLLLFLSKPMVLTEWKSGQLQMNTCTTEDAMLHAMNHIVWSKEHQYAIAEMFSQLPNVHANSKGIVFDNFLMNISHDLFHQMSSSTNGIVPSAYLLQHDPSNSLLAYRVKIFTFNYLLGLIHAVNPSGSKKEMDKKHKGILDRIKAKILSLAIA